MQFANVIYIGCISKSSRENNASNGSFADCLGKRVVYSGYVGHKDNKSNASLNNKSIQIS